MTICYPFSNLCTCPKGLRWGLKSCCKHPHLGPQSLCPESPVAVAQYLLRDSEALQSLAFVIGGQSGFAEGASRGIVIQQESRATDIAQNALRDVRAVTANACRPCNVAADASGKCADGVACVG